MIHVSTAQPCEEINPPWQGRITCFGMVTDTNCTFSCNPGYDLVGSQSRTCLPSSRWSGNRTSCKGNYPDFLFSRAHACLFMKVFGKYFVNFYHFLQRNELVNICLFYNVPRTCSRYLPSSTNEGARELSSMQ